ncbi:hypothetical protein [Acidovorax sp. K2F]|uniref:hypothetical protein n=1 Tax=Acidovorax sp. K2F TaxID=2978125 RepID=UPI0021B0BB91|nr:hypothetical protein [Acidovorax sp. K2F]MCT6721692.1 hypothetical protein [Acidovorax sp. K2F]
MHLELTGAETGDQLVKQLVYLRGIARRIVKVRIESREVLAENARLRDRLGTGTPDGARAAVVAAKLQEGMLQAESMEIEIGNYLMPLCDALDRTATREQIFEALNINTADRDTETIREYGDKALYLITVLHLENSAMNRREDWASPKSQPLQWCHTMALMRAMTTSPRLDRMLHEGANEFFGGVFGEYRERPLMERLAGRTV